MTLGAAALLGACGGQVEGEGDPLVGNPPPQVVDGGADGEGCDSCNPPPPVCPSQVPTANSACSIVDGSSCSWGDECDQVTGYCDNGQWNFATSNPPPPLCPLTVPSQGDDCSTLCLPADYECVFPGGPCAWPSYASSWTGVCSGGVWTNIATTCIEPTDGGSGPGDAGPWPDSGR